MKAVTSPRTPRILLEDGPLLAVIKPAGLATQSPPGFPSLEAEVKEYLKAKHQKPGNVYLGIPHRLDRPVSGVVVFARNSKAAARLAEQFQQRQVKKTYWAILEGCPPEPTGTLTDRVRKVPDEARAEIVAADHAEGREAVLHYRTLGTVSLAGGGEGALVEIELVTGRMHQIRVQFASRGCPIVGDAKYGSRVGVNAMSSLIDEAAAPSPADERILLHARELTLLHPIRYESVTLTAPLPEDWPVLTNE